MKKALHRSINMTVVNTVTMTFILLLGLTQAQNCTDSLMPLTLGGNSSESLSCLLQDDHGNTLVLGSSTSADFVADTSKHAFFTSLDTETFVRFSGFFYNVSFPIRDFADCVYDAEDSLVVALASGADKPAIMGLSSENGEVKKFYTLEFSQVG